MGRPIEPVPQNHADSVIAWIESGKPLREWSRQEGNPSYGAVYDWIEKDRNFASRFARAREIGEDVIAQECLEIADDGSNDWVEGKFGPQVNQECVNRSKLRVETRLKLLSKWNPKKYGDKMDMNVTGSLDLASRLSAARDRKK